MSRTNGHQWHKEIAAQCHKAGNGRSGSHFMSVEVGFKSGGGYWPTVIPNPNL